jgi:hypothetical protein
MRRRHATIPARRRIFLGCEGESEQGYGALLSRIAEEHGLHLAPQIVLLRPGGGDPLALVQLAVAKIREDERKRGEFSIKAVLLDEDKLGQTLERDQLLYAEAAQTTFSSSGRDRAMRPSCSDIYPDVRTCVPLRPLWPSRN